MGRMAVDKAWMLTRRCPEADGELAGLGTVRVRGLTRGEIKQLGQGASEGRDMEALALSWGVVDPQLTEAEAAQWLENAPFSEIERVTQRINELSGIAGRSDKEAYKSPGQ